ncbi:MAG: acyl-CoA thioesterase [Myxococcota bacterium]|jgi:acyl-CoA hydrolase|nr:acyl-CoA thioesterase [Myxococcota bacterium]
MSSIVQEKTPEQSAVETTHVVLPPDTNSHGTAFGGKIMQWMDIAAGIAAGRHAQGPVVTVSVDDLHFARPIKMGNIVLVRAQVNYTGRTSMEIGVRVESEEASTGAREHCLSGYFTFVAVDDQGAPKAVAKLVPQCDEDQRRFDNAEERRKDRLNRRRK